MADSWRPNSFDPPEGVFDYDGMIIQLSQGIPGSSPGGGMGDGTTSGTTGRVIPPGASNPVDDEFE